MTAHYVLTTRNLQAFALLATAFGLGLAACGPVDTSEEDEVTDVTQRPTTTTPGSSLRRFLSNHPQGCAKFPPSPWVASKLFQYPGVETPPGMAGYCIYVFNKSSNPTATDVGKLRSYVAKTVGATLEEDTVVSGALGFEQDSRMSMHDALLKHAGAMADGLPKGPTPIDAVRIAFPDSATEDSSGVIAKGMMAHGSTLAWLAQDLANPVPPSNPPSPVRAGHITTSLALPQIDNDTNSPKGGFFGTRAQLAEAIYRVTAAWLYDGWNGSMQPRLVINLSVGWEPTDGCAKTTDETTFEGPTRAVFDAISHASCLGGLVLAAAGNEPGRNANEAPAKGPTCPAAWTATFNAPDDAKCVQMMSAGYADAIPKQLPIPAKTPLPAGIDNPLLYAVGGIDFARQPIAVTRNGGIPKYVAISSNASAAAPGANLPPSLTGTSVGTAVASAIAATTWAYRPELTAPELMDLIHDAGRKMGVYPDFGPNSQGEAVHSLSLCQSLQKACEPVGGVVPDRCPAEGVKCPALPKPEEGPNPPLTPNQMSLLELLFPDPMDVVLPADLPGLINTSRPPSEFHRSASVPPWVYPQPFYPPCGACALDITENVNQDVWQLFVSVNPNFDQYLELGGTTLIVKTGTSYWSSVTTVVGPIGNGTLRRGDSYSVNLGDLPNGANLIGSHVLSAQISWKSSSTKSTTVASFNESILVTH